MKIRYIDINCDMGEGSNNEVQLMPFISSCNIACGGHAGDAQTIRRVIRLAKQHNVKIGAHPSYPDKENFGRRSYDIDRQALIKSIRQQLTTFMAILNEENAMLHHIKPHGALYNDISKDEALASVFLKAISAFKQTPIYAPFQSKIEKAAARSGVVVHLEAFADRNYDTNLQLVSRDKENALIEKPEDVLIHLLNMIRNETVKTVEGSFKPMKAVTFCVHGDTPSALEILMYLSVQLPKHQVQTTK